MWSMFMMLWVIFRLLLHVGAAEEVSDYYSSGFEVEQLDFLQEREPLSSTLFRRHVPNGTKPPREIEGSFELGNQYYREDHITQFLLEETVNTDLEITSIMGNEHELEPTNIGFDI